MRFTCGCLYLCREYGTIDDVDIDLHINISFLDVSGASTCHQHVYLDLWILSCRQGVLFLSVVFGAQVLHLCLS